MRQTSAFKSLGSTIRVIKPIWRALSELIGSPINSISIPQPRPTIRGNRAVAPPPGIIPSLPSGVANFDLGVAILKSQPRATSNPPPIQIPSIAAIVGFGVRSSLRANPCMIGSKAFLRSLFRTSFRSDPEANDFPPAPVIAKTFTSGSCADTSTAALSSSTVSKDIALCL